MTDTLEAASRLAERSERLRSRRVELLPLRGPDAVFTDVQGRGWSSEPATAPAALEGLISSIATTGLLQPVLVEELKDGQRKLACGHRRLRAMRWGAVNLPDNPHFEQLQANVVDGPLTDEEVRTWQLIENLAREDLQPGELAAALVYERCAVASSRMVANGVAVPDGIAAIEDPVRRWQALDRHRRDKGLHHIGAPWRDVIGRLGLQLSEPRAKKLVRAFKALPEELSTEMDQHEVALASRLEYLGLHQGRQQAAEELWEAVRDAEAPELLTRATTEAHDHPEAAAGELVEAAEAFHEQANAARAAALANGDADEAGEGQSSPPRVPDGLVEAARDRLQQLLEHLRAGAELSRYDRGSLRLAVDELAGHLQPPAGVSE